MTRTAKLPQLTPYGTGNGVANVSLQLQTVPAGLVWHSAPAGGAGVKVTAMAAGAATILRIAGPEGPLVAPTVLLDDVPNPVGEAYAADRVWLTGDPQGRRAEVVEIDLAGPRIVARTAIPSGTRAIAVVGDSIWVASMSGQLVQLRAAP